MMRLLLVASLLLSCRGEDDGIDPRPVDAGDASVADVGASLGDAGFAYDLAPAPPAPPQPAIEPSFGPCPTGWRTVARADAPDLCDPWPASGRASCPAGEAHFPGTPGCAPLGDPCPTTEFADLGPNALYVTASTTAIGGDGTMAAPLISIAQAINVAAPGGIIVLGRGTFDERIALDREVVLMGSCVAATRLMSSAAVIDEAVVTVTADAMLQNLSIGGEQIGVQVESGRLVANHFEVAGARQIGIRVRGGEALLSDAVVRDTRSAPAAGFGFGHGITARDGGRIEAARVVVENNREIGIALRDPVATPHLFTDVAVIDTQLEPTFDTGRALNVAEQTVAVFERAVFEGNHDVSIALSYGGSLELADAVIRDSRVNSTGLFGVGMAVNADSHAEGRRVYIGGSATTGLAVGSDPNEQSTIDFTDLAIEDTGGDDAGNFGRGLEVGFGADARVERIWLANNRLHGMFVDAPGSSIIATDAFSLETRPKAADGTSGWGLSVTNGASFELLRGNISRNSSMGIGLSGPNTRVLIRDLILEETAPGAVVGPCGRGLNAQEGVELTIERARFSRNREVGLVVHDPTTVATLSDIVVEDTSTVGAGQIGSGIGAQLGAQLSLTRAVIARSRECGVFVHDAPATLALEDVVIRDGMGTPFFGTFGRGLNVQTGATATGVRVLLEDNREGSLVIANSGSSATLSDSAVKGTLQRICAATSCPNEGGGSGVVVRDSGTAALTRFFIAGNFLSGAQISDGAAIDLTDGDVVANSVGVNVQSSGFDENRVRANVRYIDNGDAVNGLGLYVPNNDATVIPE